MGLSGFPCSCQGDKNHDDFDYWAECLVIECRLFSKWHIGFLNWHYWTCRTSMYKSILCYSSCHACNRSLFEWICFTRACRWATVEFHCHGHVLDPAKPTPMLY
jgi:hypothetical protein